MEEELLPPLIVPVPLPLFAFEPDPCFLSLAGFAARLDRGEALLFLIVARGLLERLRLLRLSEEHNARSNRLEA